MSCELEKHNSVAFLAFTLPELAAALYCVGGGYAS